jgi:hypothetical protein
VNVTIKYDAAGNQLWTARYNGDGNGDDNPHAIALDKSGNVYVAGLSLGNGSIDIVTMKYNVRVFLKTICWRRTTSRNTT